MKLFFINTIFFLFVSCNNNAEVLNKTDDLAKDSTIVGGGCDGCDLMYIGMPANIPSIDTSVAWNEKGQRLFVYGTVFKLDGKTPASNIILYYHHTDNNGYYSPAPNQDARSKRDGHIRGWIKTDKKGHYALYTIRPVPYPDRGIPAHIHVTIKEPGINEYYIDEFVFDDDPFLTNDIKKKQENRGGNGILHVKDQNGIQVTEHNIILGLNIPNYPQNR